MIYTVFLQGQSTDLGAVSKVEYSGLQMKKERIKLKKQFMEHFFFLREMAEIQVWTNKCVG